MFSCIKGKARGYVCRFAPVLIMVAVLVIAGFCSDGFAVIKGSGQKEFRSPEEAVQALFQALKNCDSNELMAILGPDAKDLVYSGDAFADNEMREVAVKIFQENNVIVKAGFQKAVLELGRNHWPLPIPIVEENGNWRFDTKAGKEEILNRRIGRNELGAIQSCLAYVDAQLEYAQQSRDGEVLPEYAQKFLSEPGKRDGLYWETKRDEPPSPAGIFMANARQEGYKKDPGGKPVPYHGYYYRILKAQGKNARGGAYDYLVKGKMIGGFALIAYPAKYGSSGIMTFMVNHDGVVYQKDLGPKTESAAIKIKLFDPDTTWRKVE
ncbi:MAG: DUF2950 domain-containing protein [Syntrophobacteraceae bacterium]|jgi:hypothetical protein